MGRLVPLFILLLTFLLPSSAQDAAPLQVLQSTKSYGPDGPWHAVSVNLGDPPQPLDLYPGGTFESTIFTPLICDGTKGQTCGSGGLFDPSKSDTVHYGDTTFGAVSPDSSKTDGAWTSGATLLQYSNGTFMRDNLSIAGQVVAAFDIYVYSNISTIYPDGTHYPLQVGQLSLGDSHTNQSFSRPGETSINASLIPNYLQEQKIIPSSSYGLHIGSAALNLNLSLWLGGYDASRIIGPVSSQSYTNDPSNRFSIDLLDIGIGVDHGGSPFPYSWRGGFLTEGNSTTSESHSKSLPVFINPAAPYLYLPNNTCTAIAKQLPVTYSAKYGLYLWNVQDPQYTKIITSPTYLSFVFPSFGGTANITINVPFQLLNLTLDTPLTLTPVQYFPCQTPQDPTSQTYSLGRAFLQAAFVGVNWDGGNGLWFLAQAPGPDTVSNPTHMPITNSPIPGNSNSWVATWNNSWTALPVAQSSPLPLNGGPKPPSHHLASGTIAGIVVGVGCAALVGLAIGILFYRHRKRGNPTPSLEHMLDQGKRYDQPPPQEPPPIYASAQDERVELETLEAPISELGGGERYEMRQQSPGHRHG